MTKGPLLILIVILAVGAGLFVKASNYASAPVELKDRPQDVHNQDDAYQNRIMDIGTFVSVHIRELSPVQETLGGTFYVTDVQAANGKGVVTYEDGHMQYTADFTYTMNDQTGYTITKFKIR